MNLDALYTVTIESTAAMVAILAGFLITQILALATERQNLGREIIRDRACPVYSEDQPPRED